jgi:dienelactone hydrolase
MNAVARFTIAVLLVVMLTGCATPSQIPPSPTATLQPTLPSPTATQLPPEPPFTNILVYDPPEMYKVIVETVQYPTLSDPSKTLPMDVFYPPDRRPAELLPAVVLVNGFPYSLEYGSRTFGAFRSWGRLIASYGLIAVAYDTHNASDLEAVVAYIQQKGPDLGIDGSRLGLWSMSSHGGLASSFAFQENRKYLKFAVFYYAWIMTPDNFMREEENSACQDSCLGTELPDVKRLRTDLPLLVVRCGRDSAVGIAEADHFAQLAREAGVPLTLVDFEEGNHTFDWRDTSFGDVKARAVEIIQQTLEFMKTHASDS